MTPCAKCKAKRAREPQGYIAWHNWAERKAKTHRQIKCPDCGRLTWVKKEMK